MEIFKLPVMSSISWSRPGFVYFRVILLKTVLSVRFQVQLVQGFVYSSQFDNFLLFTASNLSKYCINFVTQSRLNFTSPRAVLYYAKNQTQKCQLLQHNNNFSSDTNIRGVRSAGAIINSDTLPTEKKTKGDKEGIWRKSWSGR